MANNILTKLDEIIPEWIQSLSSYIDNHAALILLLSPIALIIFVAIADVIQTKHTIKRNFPVIGFARYFLEFIGPELRQYLFIDERADRPIPRYIRTWIYANSKKQLSNVAFGTRKDVDKPGTMLIRHSAYPHNHVEQECDADHRILIGAKRRQPYSASLLNISAMSYGALGKNAILALGNGAKIGGFYHNTGEGGISRYHLETGADLVFQIGTGKFGVRDEHGNFSEEKFIKACAIPQVKMIEIKLSQGAKPGKGGVLPKAKISKEVAEARGVSGDSDVISPPAHKEWDDAYGLLDWISKLQELGGKPVGIKFCLGRRSFVRELVKAMQETGKMPDYIAVDGAEGGTGAAPLAHTDYVGYPLKDALMYVDNVLREAGLREEIKLMASGKVFTGADLAIMLALGADLCQSARGFMLSIGCIHALKCNTNFCPAGVATHDPWLQRGLVVKEKSPRTANYHSAVIHEANSIAYSCGYETPMEMKRGDVMKLVDFHKFTRMDELVPQPPLKACAE